MPTSPRVRHPTRNRLAALLLLALGATGAMAAPYVQPPRWVTTDDLQVRVGPSASDRVSGTLMRGARVILKAPGQHNGYCFVEGEGEYGYASCEFLSDKPVAPLRAGVDGIDAAQRWIGGNPVTLREAPQADAAVTTRLALNAIVTLLQPVSASDYCEVRTASGLTGFLACRYLESSPVNLARIRGMGGSDGKPPPEYDPVRAFWLAPGWQALEQYATHLRQQHPEKPSQGPWPRDEALERMKAHLALGLYGTRPAPYPDWAALKRRAMQDLDLSGTVDRLRDAGKPVPEALQQRAAVVFRLIGDISRALPIPGMVHDQVSSPDHGASYIRLLRVLEFPPVQASLFRGEAEIAPPGDSTEDISGRFGIIYRQLVTPRPPPTQTSEPEWGPGLYDMLARTAVLARPVQYVRVFRDGRLRAESSLARQTETLWREADPEECAGWKPGFAFGDADLVMNRRFGQTPAGEKPLNDNPPGSLYAFYTRTDWPWTSASVVETSMTLSREDTGFIRGRYLVYDLDRDDIPDLAVWEGQGKGAGDIDGPSLTDDNWYRLVVVNIGGAWKVLGSDSFGYGCGC